MIPERSEEGTSGTRIDLSKRYVVLVESVEGTFLVSFDGHESYITPYLPTAQTHAQMMQVEFPEARYSVYQLTEVS